MPSFDGGHYFLTAFFPVSAAPIDDGSVVTSPVHALRKELAKLPSIPTFDVDPDAYSPFARNDRCHFARFVVIDDVAYNGRDGSDPLVDAVRGLVGKPVNLVIAQPQDHLKRPYLLLAMDFDAPDGSIAARDAFLRDLWAEMEPELGAILRFCVGYSAVPPSADRFAAYVAACEVATTMPFNDYYIDPPALPSWGPKPILAGAAIGGIAALLGVVGLCVALVLAIFGGPAHGLASVGSILLILGLVGLAIALWMLWGSLRTAGETPFPPGPSLVQVLKALYLQKAFTRFAIDNQGAAPATLQANFAAFLAATKPNNLSAPTQAPGGF